MQTQSGRIAGFVALLAALWIGVYWWWPSGHAKVSFASGENAAPAGPNGAGAGGTSAPQRTVPVKPAEVSRRANTPSVSTPRPVKEERPVPREVLPPIAVEPPQFIEHTVKQGETLSVISKKYFGSSSHVNDILRSNPYLDPTRLKPGRVIKIPKDPGNIQGKPVPHPDPVPPGPDNAPALPAIREYVVQPGDTLSGIASDIYGTSGMARAIYEANRSIMADEDSLRVGMKLKLPPKDR
ncbi:MAG: LysM domain-containing protein [Phycisphaerales bacterium]